MLAIPAYTACKTWEHRVVDPESTLARLLPKCADFGITRLADLTDLDRVGIPIFQAIRPMGLSLSMSQGKGATAAASKVSALMESIEVWHAEHESVPTQHKKYSDMPPTQTLSPLLFRKRNVECCCADDAMLWCAGEDLCHGSEFFVPKDAVNLDFTRSAEPCWLFRNTNGLAGGNSIAEATASALAEVIERDCKADFHAMSETQKSTRRLCLDHLSKSSPKLADLIERIQAADLCLDVFDMTNEIGVFAAEAAIYETGVTAPVHWPALGNGAHLDPITALMRAIAEAAQSRLAYISANRDDLSPDYYTRANTSNLLLAFDAGFDRLGSQRRVDLDDQSTASPEADVDAMLSRLIDCRKGPVIRVDLSKPEHGIPVVKVLAPTLKNKVPRRSLRP